MDYTTSVEKDMTAISLLFEQFDALDTSAVVCFRDKNGRIIDIYCGNPRLLMSCYASILNENAFPNTSVMEEDIKKNVEHFAEQEDAQKTEQLTAPSKTPERSDYDPESIGVIKDILDRHTDPDEAWVLGFSVVDKSTGLLGTFFGKHGDPVYRAESISASISRFIQNEECPFCGGKWDYSHFITHIKQVLEKTICVRKNKNNGL